MRSAAKLMPYADQWYHYMSGFFMQAYLKTVKGQCFLPKDAEDLKVLLQTFLLEKAIYELAYELNNRPDWVIIPLRGIKRVMEEVVRPSARMPEQRVRTKKPIALTQKHAIAETRS